MFRIQKSIPMALIVCLGLALLGGSSGNAADTDDAGPFLASLKNVANPSTVPSNGDVNPYGVAFVPHSGGSLKSGSILVSNFNNSMNTQGTGTTIVQIDKRGNQSLFFQGSGLGLTTALGVLPGNLVIVGSVPTDMSGAALQGSLLILSRTGAIVQTLTSATMLDGPWDLTVQTKGNSALVFVSNVLSGTVTRFNLSVKKGGVPTVTNMTQIASGYLIRTDPNALVVGPTGLVFDSSKNLLYVASTGDNKIFSIANAATTTTDGGMGTVVYSDPAHLRGPLALAMAPNGDLLTTNGDAVNPDVTQTHNSEIVEFTPSGSFVDELQVDTPVGAAFGIAVSNGELAAVNDNTNTLGIFVDSDTDTGKGMGGMGGMGMNGM